MINKIKNGWEKFCDYFYLIDNVERVLGGLFFTLSIACVIFGVFIIITIICNH